MGREMSRDMPFWSLNSTLPQPQRDRDSSIPSQLKSSISSSDLGVGSISFGSDLGTPPSSAVFGPGFRQRARAGTLPSRLSSGSESVLPPPQDQFLTSAFQSNLSSASHVSAFSNQDSLDGLPVSSLNIPSTRSSLQSARSSGSRIRSGSLNLPTPGKFLPFSGSVLSSSPSAHSWNFSEEPSHSLSPQDQPGISTLDYLGLESPGGDTTPEDLSSELITEAHVISTSSNSPSISGPSVAAGSSAYLSDISRLRQDVHRLRSYSTSATERYEDITSTNTLEGLIEEDEHREMIDYMQHAQLGISSRPRSRTTAGPELQSRIKNFNHTPSRLDYMQSIDSNSAKETASMIDEASIVSSFEDNSIGPTNSLYIGNIPATASVASLTALFGQFGTVDSVRILSNQLSAFISYTSIESAIQAKAALGVADVGNAAGSLKIGFAKIKASSISENEGTTENSSNMSYLIKDTPGYLDKSSHTQLYGMETEILSIVREYGADEEEIMKTTETFRNAMSFDSFVEDLPALPDPNPNRVHDAPRLREIRKRIDNGTCPVAEIEAAAIDMLDELVELASDYLGNTVVQKLFEYCSEDVKTKMLLRLAPYLAELGIHKNGTWAAQKVIDVTRTPEQMMIIAKHLRPYTVHLFLDQFGNYVLQCCLRFGSPYNDFIFETMLSRFWDIAQGRFGARAMRACLESHYASKEQQRVLAAAITLHAVQLATNANGALLLTWFLDTCTLPNRHRILAPRLIPHLVSLCTHKLASLTVLKVINYRSEPEARRAIFDALILDPEESVLEEILKDSSQGPAVIYKVLTTPFLESDIRQRSLLKVQNVLVRLKVLPSQGYRRLMDEVGLSTRASTGGSVSGGAGPVGTNGTGPARGPGHHGHHFHNHTRTGSGNGRGQAGADQRDYLQQQQHRQQAGGRISQPLSYYGGNPYNMNGGMDYMGASAVGGRPNMVDGYLAMQMDQMEISQSHSPDPQYGAGGQFSSPPMVNSAMYQQALMQQSMRQAGPQQTSYYQYMASASPPPMMSGGGNAYGEAYRGIPSPPVPSALMAYGGEPMRGIGVQGVQGVQGPQGTESPVMTGQSMVYPVYGGIASVYSPSAPQGPWQRY
ncbi:armadillo-type protein [Lipomyces oligophaga]|uniref:armadillo-type protein n=1 Tax=Lipomyces oligophaga TaxID=45792 RepID=UPI0034CDE512